MEHESTSQHPDSNASSIALLDGSNCFWPQRVLDTNNGKHNQVLFWICSTPAFLVHALTGAHHVPIGYQNQPAKASIFQLLVSRSDVYGAYVLLPMSTVICILKAVMVLLLCTNLPSHLAGHTKFTSLLCRMMLGD